MVFSITKMFFRLAIVTGVLISSVFAQTPPAPETAPPSPMDLDACKQVVTSYCTAWKAQELNAMYALLSPQGMGAMDNEKFTKQQQEYLQWGCKLSAFSVKEAAPNNEDVAVTVELSFAKEIKPSMVNGVYTVQMVKDTTDE